MGNVQTDFRENKNRFLSIDMGMVKYFLTRMDQLKLSWGIGAFLDNRRDVDEIFTISCKISTKITIDELRIQFYKFEPQEGRRDRHKLDENRLFLTLDVILINRKKQTLVLKHTQKAPEKTDAEVQHHANRNGRF